MAAPQENLVLCGPSGTGKTLFLEALGQLAVEQGLHVAWFTLEDIGGLIRRHRADDAVHKAIARILATATVDRLLHHAHICQTSGDSVWLSQALTGRGVTPLT